jgi:sugar phosphate isomerase/epimerase
MTTRRDFLQTSAAVLVAGCARATPSLGRLTAVSLPGGRPLLGFSTLGCPRWDWNQIVDFAATHDYSGIELRGIGVQMDLSKVPQFAPSTIAATRHQLADRGLRIVDLGASANMHETDAGKRAADFDEARRFIDLASSLDAKFIRVFGNKYLPGVPREATLERVASGLRELGNYAHDKNVTVLLESHGDFTDSPSLLEIMRRTDSPGVALLWDAHHTFAFGHEAPEDTYRQIGSYVRHVHLKDSVPAGDDRRYVLTGAGDVPVRRQIEVLARNNYPGYYNFEWEKRWHPEIEEPEVAFAQFAEVASGYFREARR